MKLDENFWKGKRVFITGHTGFKGSWISFWLSRLGACVSGYSLQVNSDPSMFDVLGLEDIIDEHTIADICDYDTLYQKISGFKPDVVFHLAAQSLVRYSYKNPRETYNTNVIGTVNLLDAVREYGKVKSTVVITSDKCYENKEQEQGYKETDPMGGHDPYSNSKGCAELVVSSYTKSFFLNNTIGALCSVRAGNVIGGGDWSEDRLIPDIVRSIFSDSQLVIRNPDAIRPWQHVLEPIYGYLLVAQHIYQIDSQEMNLNWNFGPDYSDQRDVKFIVDSIVDNSSLKVKVEFEKNIKNSLHEAKLLYLDCAKVKKELSWSPKMTIDDAISYTMKWYESFYKGEDMKEVTWNQIQNYKNRF